MVFWWLKEFLSIKKLSQINPEVVPSDFKVRYSTHIKE